MANEEYQIPIFLINGQLDSGKTRFISDTIAMGQFADAKNKLLIVCEEGEEEYSEKLLKDNGVDMVVVEKEDFNIKTLNELDKKYDPWIVIVEYNGMWDPALILGSEKPRGWQVYQSITLVDANAFGLQWANMKSIIAESVKYADMVIFNRCKSGMDLGSYRRSMRALNPALQIIFEDEKVRIPEGEQERFDALPPEYSHLYLAIEGRLAAVICIEDPLRPEARDVIKNLKKVGFQKIVMMTGDSERTAKAIAKKVGVDEYYAEVLPEDKANFVEKEKVEGRKVIMIGDGINDSPALSAADVGIAISEGAEIAREIADITVAADDLAEILVLRMLSNRLMKRIHKNYRFIVTFNAGLILLGVGGILQPTTSALLHNTSTLYIGLKSMGNLLDEPV